MLFRTTTAAVAATVLGVITALADGVAGFENAKAPVRARAVARAHARLRDRNLDAEQLTTVYATVTVTAVTSYFMDIHDGTTTWVTSSCDTITGSVVATTPPVAESASSYSELSVPPSSISYGVGTLPDTATPLPTESFFTTLTTTETSGTVTLTTEITLPISGTSSSVQTGPPAATTTVPVAETLSSGQTGPPAAATTTVTTPLPPSPSGTSAISETEAENTTGVPASESSLETDTNTASYTGTDSTLVAEPSGSETGSPSSSVSATPPPEAGAAGLLSNRAGFTGGIIGGLAALMLVLA